MEVPSRQPLDCRGSGANWRISNPPWWGERPDCARAPRRGRFNS